MTSTWERCIYFRGAETTRFLREYLAQSHRRIYLIAGAGFDPRSKKIAELLATMMGDRMSALFLREERPDPATALLRRADEHEQRLRLLVSACTVVRFPVFGPPPSTTVVGGREAIKAAESQPMDDVTDIFLDMSALSIGVGFPLARYLLEIARQRSLNLHLLVVEEPFTDTGIKSISCDVADTIHTFKGDWDLDERASAAKLWVPQLSAGKRGILERIHAKVMPHAVCPVIPFPASDPKTSDRLIEHYSEEFQTTWNVDGRDLIYANEGDPPDLYRTILRMDDLRMRVFEGTGGSQIILSPVGSKTLAIGALMAALDRKFPIMHVESLGYEVDLPQLDAARAHRECELVHVWLHGDAYPKAQAEVDDGRE